MESCIGAVAGEDLRIHLKRTLTRNRPRALTVLSAVKYRRVHVDFKPRSMGVEHDGHRRDGVPQEVVNISDIKARHLTRAEWKVETRPRGAILNGA